jgi:hypothetical protein
MMDEFVEFEKMPEDTLAVETWRWVMSTRL